MVGEKGRVGLNYRELYSFKPLNLLTMVWQSDSDFIKKRVSRIILQRISFRLSFSRKFLLTNSGPEIQTLQVPRLFFKRIQPSSFKDRFFFLLKNFPSKNVAMTQTDH